MGEEGRGRPNIIAKYDANVEFVLIRVSRK